RAAARGRLGVPESVPLIVSVGLLVRRKGFDVLVRAMEWVRSDHPDVRLLIAGDEPDGMGGCREELEALIEELELGECVTLLGHRGDVPELLAACDVFVLASREEGDPAAVLEAMATGLPVLVTEPASAAVEQFVTGLVVRPDDHLCLSQRLSILLAVPSLHDEWGQAGRRVVEARHDLDRMVRRYEEAWESVLGSGG
ncbi:MAG: glycosyltransferase, partial [Armatimonadota bacterium]